MSRALPVVLALAAHWPAWLWAARVGRHGGDSTLHALAAAAALAWIALGLRRARSAPFHDPRVAAVVLATSCGFGLAVGGLPAAVAAVATTVWVASPACTGRRFSLALFGVGLSALPLLPIFELTAGPSLRVPAAEGAAVVLGSLGFDVAARGTVLVHPGGEVWVDPACAGLGMLWTALFVACAAAGLRRISNGATLAAMGVAALAVAVGNAWRVVALFVLETAAATPSPWLHAGTGLAVEALVLVGVLVVTGRGRKGGGEPCAATACS